MFRIDYLEDDDGNLTKVLISDKKFEIMHLTNDKGEPEFFAITLHEDMECAITQGWES